MVVENIDVKYETIADNTISFSMCEETCFYLRTITKFRSLLVVCIGSMMCWEADNAVDYIRDYDEF